MAKTMKNCALIISSVILTLLFTACGGSSNEPGVGQGIVAKPQSCDLNSQKQFIFDVMHDTYLWYDEVPTVDINDFDDLNSTLDALKAPLDRFSFINSLEANDNFFEQGTFEGFGFRAVINEPRDAYQIAFVFNNSPSGAAGWKRTDRITAINGVSAANIINGDGLNAALVGDTATFTIGDLSAPASDQVLTKALVIMNTVLTADIVTTETQNIGYIALSSFIENTSKEFSDAIDLLKAANVDELVLDLRYNGGGRVIASRNVASYIGGDLTKDFNFSKTTHNNKYTQSNATNPFQNFSNSLGLSRVYVLTSQSTCSASELVINSLSPFLEVVQIGATTCGKPVGMYGKTFCDKILLPIEFQSVNNNDEGDYFDGLPADCPAIDDLTHDFADPAESMLSTAIFHMNNSSCQTLAKANLHRTLKTKHLDNNWLPQKQVN